MKAGQPYLAQERRDSGRPSIEIDATPMVNAIEALADAIVIYDSDGKLVVCNAKHREFYPQSAHLYRSGACRTDILRHHAKTLHQDNPELDIEKYIADRMSQVHSARPDSETRLLDGR